MTSRPGRTAAEQLLHAAVSRWSGDPRSHDVLAYAVRASRADGSTAHPTATRAAMELWDEDAAAILARRDVDRVRSSGASSALPRALDLQACLHVARGEMQAAVHAADEAATVARRTGAAEPALARILLTGWQATAEDRLEWIDAWSRRASSNGDGSALTLLDFGRALAHLASGRYEQALHDARRVFDRDESFISGWAAPDVVEAAVRSGRPDDAAPAFAWIRSVSDVTGSAWARGIEHRCRALLARDDSAEQHFVESVGHLTRSGMRLDLARTHLLHGEWLRRQARRVDARTSLRQALELFDAAGATAFAGRASIELRASGQQARPRTPDTLLALTDRESQVAELVIEGFSNPDIGRQLFISPRTVEYHLSKVFTKLGITSRAQLRAAWQR
jgi:DNA-binding CsgD family transcriptional regulator